MKILSAEFVISAATPEQFPSDRKPQIAFAGRSNVGKSSIINTLLNRKSLVKTSATPGKTQLVNFFMINESFYFVDLPGYGFARVPRAVTDAWGPLIESYLTASRALRAVVVLLDARREPDERDLRMISWLREFNIPSICALTKSDKLTRQEIQRSQREISARLVTGEDVIPTSAKSGLGIKELWAGINKRLSAKSGQ